MARLVRLGFSGLILFCASLLYAGGFFFGATGGSSGGGGGGGSPSSCTLSSNWGSGTCSNASVCTVTSATRTLTVPGGNPGTLTFSTDDEGFGQHVALQYSKNAGAFTTVAENATVTFASGDTIALKITSESSGPTTTVATVVDTTTGATVGTFSATNTHA